MKRQRWYKLNERNIEPCVPDKPYLAEVCTIKQEEIVDVFISTVFLSRDHSFVDGPPVLFETMIFGGQLDENQWRYHTYDEAEQGHKDAVKRVIKTLSKRDKKIYQLEKRGWSQARIKQYMTQWDSDETRAERSQHEKRKAKN